MSQRRRTAFSLIEVLIALGLTVLLLTAVYAAVDLFIRYQTVGRGPMERNQITRALRRRMTDDISSLVLYIPSEDDDAVEDVDVVEDEAEQVANSALTIGGLEDQSVPLTFGVVGDATSLHLSLSKPARGLSYSNVGPDLLPQARSSDLLAVTYALAPVDPNDRVDALGQPVQQSIYERTYQPGFGLGRRAVDLYQQEVTPPELAEEHLLAPEVSEVSFRYFDGGQWLDVWDSRQTGTLPRAIEVTFGFWNLPPKRVGQSLDTLSAPAPVTYLSLLFYVPLSIPEVVY